MVDFQTVAAIIFLVILTIFVLLKRKSLDTKQIIPYFLYFSMYKTKFGLKLMDSLAKKHKKLTLYIGYMGILVGFVGMVLISYALISNIYVLFTKPEASPGVGLVLPFKAKGVFYVPFFYWIISIFIIAVVHEFAHGLIARANNLKVKSSGFAFLGSGFRGTGLVIVLISLYFKIRNQNLFFDITKLIYLDYYSPDFWLVIGIALVLLSFIKSRLSLFGYIPVIPAAFVEPDEKELRKRPHKEQLSVFAAGPFSNIAMAFLFVLIILFVLAPITNALIEPNGVKITDYVKGNEKFPAEKAGIKIGDVVQQVDDKPTPYIYNLSTVLRSKKPDDVVTIKTTKSIYEVKLASNPENESLAYIGAYLEQSTKIKDSVRENYGGLLPNILVWLSGLFVFLYILNLGIGLFNLVPIGPLDGGRMLQLILHKMFNKEKGDKVWYYIGMFFLILILINITFAFVR